MAKRFAVIGSGWRAKFYLRIAASPENEFEVTGVLCRSKEKADAIAGEFQVFTTLSEQEILEKAPDFVVVCVSKPSIAEVALHWRKEGFTVLCETPVGLSEEDLSYAAEKTEKPLIVAEQYPYYETYRKMIEVVSGGKLGRVISADVSLAHDYHGAGLIRRLLSESPTAGYRLMAKKYQLPVTKTGDRYFVYEDGEVINKVRTKAWIEYEDGKIAAYDFDSEQYHSLIRHNSIKITGTRGELINEKLWYLDEENRGREEQICSDIQAVRAEKSKDDTAAKVLSEDERAILQLLEYTYSVSKAVSDKTYPDREQLLSWAAENLAGAIADVRFMKLLSESEGKWITAAYGETDK